MQTVIYADVLAALNFILTYLLLLATSSLLHLLPSPLRLFLGSAVGAAASFVIFLPDMGMFVSVLMKAAICCAVSLTAFKCSSVRFFIKCNLIFLLVNFLFAGLIFGVLCLFAPGGIQMNNGAVYFDLSFLSLVVTAVVCFILVSLYNLYEKRSADKQEIYAMRIYIGEKCFSCAALYDSGNKLTDGYFGSPVTVVQFEAIRDFLPYELRPFFSGEIFDIYECGRAWSGRIRFIPAVTVGDESLLPCFRADRIEIDGEKNTYVTNRAIVAVTIKGFKSGDYQALAGPLMFADHIKGGKNEIKTKDTQSETTVDLSGDIGERAERSEKPF